MKKIAKLTWLHNGNFGSVLQAAALQRYLLEQGYDVIDLDYNASLSEKLKNWIRNRNSPKLFLGKFEEAKRKKNYKNPEEFVKRGEKFSEFEEKWIKRGQLCHTPVEIKEESKKYDIFICGSDQIWSPALMNPIFYLDFVQKGKKKIAYAPSFGVTSTTTAKEKKITEYLKTFSNISVRESQGQQFIKKLIGKNVPVVIDPTLLLSTSIWNEYAIAPEIEEDYILCYLLTPNSKYLQAVSKFAKEKGLDVVIVPTTKGPFDTGFKEIIGIGPAEWLGLIQNSKYVFTDSFHGYIFSSLFHKEFILFKRFKDENKASENSRIYTLAKMLDVEERIIDESNLNAIGKLKMIDFEKVDAIIEGKAKESKDWLLNALKEVGA